MFDLLGGWTRPRLVPDDHVARDHRGAHDDHVVLGDRLPSQRGGGGSRPLPARPSTSLPPSVARVAARTRLSAELLVAILEVDGRTRATLDDMERADALADVLLARRRQRVGRHRPQLAAAAHRD